MPYLMRSASPGRESLAYAEDLLNDRILLKPLWPPYQLPGDPTWNEDPFRSRSWRLYYHGLLGVGHLLNAYEIGGDLTCLLKARLWIESWLAAKGKVNRPGRGGGFAWNEGSVASRTLTFVQFLFLWRASPFRDQELEGRILDAIRAHARCLANEHNYKRHNHGILQDRALLEVALLFPDVPEAADWYATATSRLLERCRDDVTPLGVHLEHSTWYHIFFMKLYYSIRDFMEAYGVYEGQFDEVLARMERYLAHVLRADGTLPLIGDSRLGEVRSMFKRRATSDELRYVISGGKQGRRPTETDAIFDDAGVAVFRDSWESSRPVSLVFVAGFHSTVHKHADDLSFVLRIGETDFLIDSGSYNYDGTDPITAYERSTLAHNTISVDGASYPIARHQIGRSGIDGFALSEDEAEVWGSHRLFDGVTVTRKLTYRKPDEIVIHDVVTSDDEHCYVQVFNIGEKVEMSKTDTGVLLRGGAGGAEVELAQTVPVDEVRHYRGQTGPHLGWATHRFGNAFPIDVVHFVKRGRTVEFITRLLIKH